jgi:outer membrane beta-barrel protein
MTFRALLAFAVLAIFSTSHGAAAASGDAAVDPGRDDYDFSWLDPEKKIYVVQNRKYTKAQRLELATGYGVGMGETYRTQRTWSVRGIFYLSEHFGVSAFMLNNTNTENDTFTQMKIIGTSVIPTVRDTDRYVGGSVIWLPFYGKVNMFNQILYIDWHFEAGLGTAATEIDLNTRAAGQPVINSASFTGFHWGSGWKFFINRNWGARLDFLSTYYKAPNGLRGTLDGSEEQSYDNYYLTLGVSYTL